VKKKIILISFLLFLISSISYSQSLLPKCKGTDREYFNNCFGEYMFFKSKYVGEFQNTLPNGQGTMIYWDNSKYVGEWKDGKPHGQGTYDLTNGQRHEGEWKNGNFVKSSQERKLRIPKKREE